MQKKSMLKIGVIGCGSIGTEICKAIDRKIINAELAGVHDRMPEHCERLLALLDTKPDVLVPDELISRSDIVVECASQQAVLGLGLKVLERGKDLMVMSVGAFAHEGVLKKFIDAAVEHNCRIYVPSGAIGGLDGLKSASIASLNRIMLTTVKNPAGLKSAPFVLKNNIDLDSFHKKTLLFEGSAEDAICAFPANVNVAASLSIAGIGVKDTTVRIFVDPGASRNIHEVSVEGAFGKLNCRIENIPSPNNPGTSFLAALSAIATLKKITEPLQIGT